MPEDPHPHEDAGGDPVCWLAQTCPDCGAMPSEQETTDRCWRCGRVLTDPPDGAAPDGAAQSPTVTPRQKA